MKKFYYSLFAAASMMLAVTSCSQEEDFVQSSSEMTTFSVQLDGATQSRTAGDGKTVDKLYYAVYNESTGKVVYPVGANYGTAGKQEGGWKLDLPLMKSETYDILFWAQKDGSSAYSFDELTNITVNYDGVLSNKEDRDAFFNALDNFKASGSEHTIVLRRPFAQLNIATTIDDWNDAKKIYNSNNGTDEVNPVSASAVTVSNQATNFNVLTGAATATVAEGISVTFGANSLINESIKIKRDGKEVEYKLLAMNYLLPVVTKEPNGVDQYIASELDPAKDVVEVEFTLYKGENKEQIANVKVPSTPIQRNYRTNIIGDLLTGENFDVIIDKDFDGEENKEIEISADGIEKYADGFYHITKSEGLWALAKLVNYGSTASEGRAVTDNYTFEGETFVLDCDIDLAGAEWIPIGNAENSFQGTFDGNNKTVSNFKVTEKEGYVGLFGNVFRGEVKNVKVKNVTLKAHHYAGGVVGKGYVKIENCHAENVNITITPKKMDDGSYDWGDKAGGIIGQNGEGQSYYVKGCKAKNVSVTGYRDLGGIVGMAQYGNTVSGNTVEAITIVKDFTNGYKTEQPTTFGAVIGRRGENNGTTVTESSNSADDEATFVEINGEEYPGYYKDANGNLIVTEDNGITNLIKEGETIITLSDGNYTIPDEAKGKTLTFIGTGNPEDVTINSQDDGGSEGDCDYSLDGATATFENVTITTTATYFPGYARMKGTYNNCIINGVYTLYDNSTFTNCTFNISGDFYNVWTWGATEATFNKCTFNSDGKAVLLYGQVNTKLTINECVFNDKGGLSDKKAAIEIGNDYNKSYELTVNKTIVNGYEINDKGIITGTTLFGNKNSMSNEVLKVVVDGLTFVSAGIWKDSEENYIVSNSDALTTALADENIQNIKLGEGEFGTIVATSGKTIIGTENAKVDCVNLNGADNITLKNIKFDAAKCGVAYDGKGNAKQNANIFNGGIEKPGSGTRGLVIESCTFEGKFVNGGTAIAFTDQGRGSGQSGDITIKGCTFNTQNGYYDIYAHYSGYGSLNIEGNTFNSTVQGLPIYLGRYQSSTPVVVKDNAFETVASFGDAAYIQAHSEAYTVSFDASNNTFATANE